MTECCSIYDRRRGGNRCETECTWRNSVLVGEVQEICLRVLFGPACRRQSQYRTVDIMCYESHCRRSGLLFDRWIQLSSCTRPRSSFPSIRLLRQGATAPALRLTDGAGSGRLGRSVARSNGHRFKHRKPASALWRELTLVCGWCPARLHVILLGHGLQANQLRPTCLQPSKTPSSM